MLPVRELCQLQKFPTLMFSSSILMHSITDIILVEISLRCSVISWVNERSGLHEVTGVSSWVTADRQQHLTGLYPSQFCCFQLFKHQPSEMSCQQSHWSMINPISKLHNHLLSMAWDLSGLFWKSTKRKCPFRFDNIPMNCTSVLTSWHVFISHRYPRKMVLLYQNIRTILCFVFWEARSLCGSASDW